MRTRLPTTIATTTPVARLAIGGDAVTDNALSVIVVNNTGAMLFVTTLAVVDDVIKECRVLVDCVVGASKEYVSMNVCG